MNELKKFDKTYDSLITIGQEIGKMYGDFYNCVNYTVNKEESIIGFTYSYNGKISRKDFSIDDFNAATNMDILEIFDNLNRQYDMEFLKLGERIANDRFKGFICTDYIINRDSHTVTFKLADDVLDTTVDMSYDKLQSLYGVDVGKTTKAIENSITKDVRQHVEKIAKTLKEVDIKLDNEIKNTISFNRCSKENTFLLNCVNRLSNVTHAIKSSVGKTLINQLQATRQNLKAMGKTLSLAYQWEKMEISVMYLQAKDAAVGFVKRKTDFDIDKKARDIFHTNLNNPREVVGDILTGIVTAVIFGRNSTEFKETDFGRGIKNSLLKNAYRVYGKDSHEFKRISEQFKKEDKDIDLKIRRLDRKLGIEENSIDNVLKMYDELNTALGEIADCTSEELSKIYAKQTELTASMQKKVIKQMSRE